MMTALRRTFSWLALLGVMLAACGQPVASLPPTIAPVPLPTPTAGKALRFPRLAKGVNLTGWFWYAPEGDAAVRARFSDAEFRQLRALGLTYVRLPIDLGYLLDESSPDLLDADHLALVDEGIRRLLDADLAVMVDLHSTSLEDSNAANYSRSLEKEPFVDLFVRWWESFAAHLSQFSPEMVVLGPMNEPVFMSSPKAWNPIQVRLVAAIRAKAPRHTIVAVGSMWSSVDSLVNLPVLADDNLVYDFHFYDPFPFTHQGATWSSKELQPLRSVPYPSSPDGVRTLAANLTDADARRVLLQYGYQNWNAESLRQRIAPAAEWAAKNQVAVLCTEFGVLRDYAPPADRARWIEDMRTILEANGIGWAMWDYDLNFGLAQRSGGVVMLDAALEKALGLTTAP